MPEDKNNNVGIGGNDNGTDGNQGVRRDPLREDFSREKQKSPTPGEHTRNTSHYDPIIPKPNKKPPTE